MDNCPCCGRKLKSLEDFPRIYIVELKRLELPEIVAGEQIGIAWERGEQKGLFSRLKKDRRNFLPEEVSKLFQQSGKDVIAYQDKVYVKAGMLPVEQGSSVRGLTFNVSQNLTPVAQKATHHPVAEGFLSYLEGLAGKEVSREELSAHPIFKQGSVIIDGYNLPIGFMGCMFDWSASKRYNRKCHVKLSGVRNCEIDINLASLTYEGRLNYDRK